MNRAWQENWEFLEPATPDDGKILKHEGIWSEVIDTTMFGDDKQ